MKSMWELEQREKSGFRRIGDLPRGPWAGQRCFHPEHNPPGYIVLEPGIYEYVCPGCGYKHQIIQRGSRTL